MLEINTGKRDGLPIRIDGKDYRMRSSDDVNRAELRRIIQLRTFAVAIQSVEDPTEEDLEKAISAVDEMLAIMMPKVPEKVRAKLDMGNIEAVVAHFLQPAHSRMLNGATG